MASVLPPSSNRPLYRQFLRPSWLAGAISIGFHGALFAAGPTFPSLGFNDLVEPELASERRNVPLVELTQAEQERLPDFSNSFYNFDTFDDLEPLTPLFEDNELSSPDDEGDDTIAKVPSPLTRSRPIPTPSPRLPFGITSLGSRPRTTTLPSLPSTSSRRSGNSTSALPTPEDTPEGQSPNGSGAIAPNQGTAADLRPESDDPDASAQENPEIAVGSDPSEVMTLAERLQAYTYDATATQTDAAQARFDEWLTAGQTLAEELNIADEFAVADDLRLLENSAAEKPAAEGDETDAAEAETADEADVAEESTEGVVRRPIELPIDYEQGLCLTKAPQKGLIGAWVGPDGELLGEPEIIRSTGYSGLNQQAIRYIKTLDFSSVDTFTGYQFEVVVNYNPENCENFGQRAPADNDEDVAQERENTSSEKAPRKNSAPNEPLLRPSAPDEEPDTPAPAETDAQSSEAQPETSAADDASNTRANEEQSSLEEAEQD